MNEDFHAILLERNPNIEAARLWCVERYVADSWYTYVFMDNHTAIFGFKDQNDLFEFKMRWV